MLIECIVDDDCKTAEAPVCNANATCVGENLFCKKQTLYLIIDIKEILLFLTVKNKSKIINKNNWNKTRN